MSDHRHQVEDLYHAALKQPAGQRAAFLMEITAGDAAFRHKVESLLAHQFPEEFAGEPRELDVSGLQLKPAIRSTDPTQSYPCDPLLGTT